MSIKYSQYAFVALVIAYGPHYIAIGGLSGSASFSYISQTARYPEKWKLLNTKHVSISSTKFCLKRFLL